MSKNEDQLKVLRKIDQATVSNQRYLAKNLNFSLGKFNYILKALKKKGLVKIKNFKNNPNKVNYMYILTPKGISERAKLTINFMKKKIKEYEELKAELDSLKNNEI